MTHQAMQTHWSKLVDPLAKVEVAILGDAQGNTHALVDTLAYTVAEVRAVGDKRAMRTSWWTLADTLEEVKAVVDRAGDAHALVGTG